MVGNKLLSTDIRDLILFPIDWLQKESIWPLFLLQWFMWIWALLSLICTWDMLLVSHYLRKTQLIKDRLKFEFEIKYLGSTRRKLGIGNRRNQKEIKLFLYWESFITKVGRRFSKSDVKSVTLPIVDHSKLSTNQSSKTKDVESRIESVPYGNVVCSIMYIVVRTTVPYQIQPIQ